MCSDGLFTIHLLLLQMIIFCITFHLFFLCLGFFLLLYYFIFELLPLQILSHGLLFVLLPLIVKHILCMVRIQLFFFPLLPGHSGSLLIQLGHILLLDDVILFLFLDFQSFVHFILMGDNGGPFVVNHLFLMNWQVSFLRGSLVWLLMGLGWLLMDWRESFWHFILLDLTAKLVYEMTVVVFVKANKSPWVDILEALHDDICWAGSMNLNEIVLKPFFFPLTNDLVSLWTTTSSLKDIVLGSTRLTFDLMGSSLIRSAWLLLECLYLSTCNWALSIPHFSLTALLIIVSG